MQIQGLVGYFSWNPTAYTIGYRPTAIRLGWKPIPSKARVTRDDEQAHYNARYCLPDSHLFRLYISRDFVPGYSRCARYWLPAKSTPTITPYPSRSRHCANGFYRWLPTTNQPSPTTPQEAATVPTAFTVGYQPPTNNRQPNTRLNLTKLRLPYRIPRQ